MIFVNGVSISSSDSSSSQPQDATTTTALDILMAHPDLLSATIEFKSTPLSIVSDSDQNGPGRMKYVYVFQREYATVDPALVDFVGTDEATTCVGIAIRNSSNGRTSVAHLDSPEVVNAGLSKMLALLDTSDNASEFHVHLVGGYEDISHNQGHSTRSSKCGRMDGYSFPLCRKIIKALQKSCRKFTVQTLCILHHNTRRDPGGNTCPIFNGFLIETKSGLLVPASFDRSTRCPDNIVRGIRVTAACEDPNWDGELLETYDTEADQFIIAPCRWSSGRTRMIRMLQNVPDSEILLTWSTSPSAEGPDFVNTLRRQWEYLLANPDWRRTFPSNKPRIFKRTSEGDWQQVME